MELKLLWEGLLWFLWWHGDQHSLPRPVSDSRHYSDMPDGTKCFVIDLFSFDQTRKFSCKTVVTKITSRISKLWSVFEKLGLAWNIGREHHFSAHEWRKKIEPSHLGIPKSQWQWRSPFSTRQPRGDCKLAWISAVS